MPEKTSPMKRVRREAVHRKAKRPSYEQALQDEAREAQELQKALRAAYYARRGTTPPS